MSEDKRCHFCQHECTEDDYCHGCKSYVCDEHSVNVSLMGAHDVNEHLEENYEDGEDDLS